MPIPESQLKSWSHQGSVTQSADTYNKIKNTLEANTTPFSARDFDVFLQGSYGNNTNIYAESDVDIVIQLNDAFYSNFDELSDEEKDAYRQAFPDAKYTLKAFKEDVLSVLDAKYGSDVQPGAKAVAIKANGSRRKADVIISCQYRRYSNFQSGRNSSYSNGICFFDSEGKRIANFPKQHRTNLRARHQASSNLLKPMVRIFKNIRGKLLQNGKIQAGTAPSYFLEGLLYNVPLSKLSGSYQDSVINVLNWYLKEAQKTELTCPNEHYYLLRQGTHACWAPADSDAFINSVVMLWNEW